MIDVIYPVQIGTKRYSKEFQVDEISAKSWRSVLDKAYGVTHATCCCPGKGGKKLAIKLRESSDSYHLARFAGTGAEHANQCRFYAPAPEASGLQGYATGVVVEGDDGSLRIKLARGLRVLPTREAEDEARAMTAIQPGIRRPAMTLLGLLHFIWQESRLNTWYPAMEGKRNLFSVAKALANTAPRINAGRVRLNEVLLLPSRKDSDRARENQSRVQAALDRGLRLVVIAPLARYDAPKHGDDLERLPLSMPFGMPTLYLNDQWSRAGGRFQREISLWKDGNSVMAIAQAEVRMGKKYPYAKVLDLALMSVSDRWIPTDSSYEALVEQQLRAEGRAFEKPLRFDAREEDIFPDFWMLDTDQPYPMEVFGMATPEYLARKHVKERYYTREYGSSGWWRWDASSDPSGLKMPAFPKKGR
ncbi:DUF1173 family protein [Pseudomonas aeruginosa]|nr:DUF1173 family protein [Pseudomonas aeruginosa]ELR2942358.1 DUF1173 family protein [Pseudomonas aeruginosa]